MKRLLWLTIWSLLACRCSNPSPVAPTSLPSAQRTNGALLTADSALPTAFSRVASGADLARCLAGPGLTGCLSTARLSAEVAGGLPDAPTAFAATVAGNTVALTWTPPPAVDVVTSFVIEAGTQPGVTDLASLNTGGFITTFTAGSVPIGTYAVRVRAVNSAGIGPPSNEITVVVGASCTLPGAPASLTIVSNSNGNVVLGWQPAPGTPASYVVQAGTAPGAANLADSAVGLVATISRTVPPGTYYVRIRARNACGTGPASNEVVLIVGGGPPSTTTRTFAVNCTSIGQLCSPVYSTTVDAARASGLQLSYRTAPQACSPVRLRIAVDGDLRATTAFIAPSQSPTGPIDLGPVTAGPHSLTLQAEGQASGCNVGRLESWGGDLTITVWPL